MSKALFFIFYVWFLFAPALYGRNNAIAAIPFERVGSYIVVKVRINSSSALRLILDSGVRNTIITELLPEDSAKLNLLEIKQLQGLGQGKTLNAGVSRSNEIQLNRNFILRNKTILLLNEDLFNLSNQTGTKINGLLGYDFFSDYIVEIDYQVSKIRFYKPENFIVPESFGAMPMIVERNKMYIFLSVLETVSERRTIKMLIDTGAELNAWFQTLSNDAVGIPGKSIQGRIGQGLSGEINGFYARVPQICIANFCVKDPVVAFPDSSSIAQIMLNSDRDGTIGSQLLCRFNLIIDPFAKKFYFKPNRSFNKPFTYNIAGIEVMLTSEYSSQVEVVSVWKNSPAEIAGVKIGDIIQEVNSTKMSSISLSELRYYFERPSKNDLKLIVIRNSELKNIRIKMKETI